MIGALQPASMLTVKSLVMRFGGLLATDHLDLDVRSGEQRGNGQEPPRQRAALD